MLSSVPPGKPILTDLLTVFKPVVEPEVESSGGFQLYSRMEDMNIFFLIVAVFIWSHFVVKVGNAYKWRDLELVR